MMQKFKHSKIVFFLIIGLVLTTFAQNTDRPVIIVGKTTATPTPKPTVSPTPVIAPTPLPIGSIQTLSELQSKIRLSGSRYDIRRGMIGIKIVSLTTGKIIYEENAEKYFMPASNMKSFAVATAIEKLSPNFRFVTSVFANSQPDSNGVIKGDLTIYGRGDISFSTAFYNGDYYRGLDILAEKIAQTGVKRIEGNLVGDESYFTGNALPFGWEWDDLQWYYGAEVSALPLNDNALDLSVTPSQPSAPCIVKLLPINPIMRIVNTCKTTKSNEKRTLTVKKLLDQNILEISGTMPVGDKGFTNYITISRPAELFVALLKQRLQLKGVIVAGQTRVIGTKEKAILAVASSVPPIELTRLESPLFSLIAAKTMKPSQNLYTETILWTLGEQLGDKSNPQSTSSERGIAVVRDFMNEIGVAPDGYIQYDGSGLSRHNLITPAALVQLYSYMGTRSKFVNAWLDSLTIGGVDGTLKNRFRGTKATDNVRGKTGTIDQVSALSGYVTTSGNEKLVFSIMVNGVNDNRLRVNVIDEIVGSLANFNGKIN
jgi:D-alanyl-D-alanine carboxypeptidase/D-alanyl-D-alanine-endopeptidase (penicillin-binding protein 4)